MRFKDSPLLWLIVGGLATWRITSIIHREKIAAPVRKAVGIHSLSTDDPDDPDYWVYPDNFLGELFYCHWCLSVWVGGVVAVLCLIFPPLLLPFALSAASIYLFELKDYWAKVGDGYGVIEDEDESMDSDN